MLNNNEILDCFSLLGLLNENERNRILSLSFYQFEGKEKQFYFGVDNISDTNVRKYEGE